MNSVRNLVDAFDASLGDAPGGHVRAYEWWLEISKHFKPDGWDRAAAEQKLDRRGWLALLRYAIAKQDHNLAATVCAAGAIQESSWKPLSPPDRLAA